jgi:hypothetical protein
MLLCRCQLILVAWVSVNKLFCEMDIVGGTVSLIRNSSINLMDIIYLLYRYSLWEKKHCFFYFLHFDDFI